MNTNNDLLINELKNIKNENITEFSLNNINTKGKIVEVYDGDTCKIALIVNNVIQKFNCRLIGLDTPEMKPSINKANRDDEIKAAYKSRNRLIQLCTSCTCNLDEPIKKKECQQLLDLNNKIVNIKCHEFDKYGRLLVSIYNNNTDSKSVNTILVDEGFAKSYDGGTKDTF